MRIKSFDPVQKKLLDLEKSPDFPGANIYGEFKQIMVGTKIFIFGGGIDANPGESFAETWVYQIID